MRHILPFFIPILALAIPVAAVIPSGWAKVWRLRVGERSELHDRVDFAERRLTRGRDSDARNA